MSMSAAMRVLLGMVALVLVTAGCASEPPVHDYDATPVDGEILEAGNAMRGLAEQLTWTANGAENGFLSSREVANLEELLDQAPEALSALAIALEGVTCPGDRTECLDPLADLAAVIAQAADVVANAQGSADVAAEVAVADFTDEPTVDPRPAAELADSAAAVTAAADELSEASAAYRIGYERADRVANDTRPTNTQVIGAAGALSLVAVALALWTRRWSTRHPDAAIRQARGTVHSGALAMATIIGGATCLVALMMLLDVALGDLRAQVLGEVGLILLAVPLAPILMLVKLVGYLRWRREYGRRLRAYE